jgi:ubiquinone/menaquinone biosynthesis C-methylase UbiE
MFCENRNATALDACCKASAMPIPARPFLDVAEPYQRFRLDYPPRLIDRLVALLPLAPGDRVLDLGCGTGQLALAFARRGMDVLALDPEPQMLNVARVATAGEGLTIDFVQGTADDLATTSGPFALVTIGRAFHWMDRAAVLAKLDGLVTPRGGIALFHDAHPPVVGNEWFRAAWAVSRKYARAVSPRPARADTGHRRYEPYLFESAFSRIDGLSVTVRRPIDADSIVARAFTTSMSSPAALGEHSAAFEAELRDELHKLSPTGEFTEIAEIVAVLARRPE